MPHIALPEGLPGITSGFAYRPETAKPMRELIHGAIAAHHLNGDEDLVVRVKADTEHAPISDKLKALLVIAGKTAAGGKHVTAADVARAREQGAIDLEIHDTVLIAAVFCLCNRYVDGLATWAPDDPAFYRQRAVLVAELGYSAATLATSRDQHK